MVALQPRTLVLSLWKFDVWCEEWFMGWRTDSRSDLLVVKFMVRGKSQYPLNPGIRKSGWTLFQMKSYQDFYLKINTSEECSGNRAGARTQSSWSHLFPFTSHKLTLKPGSARCSLKTVRQPQRSLPTPSVFSGIGYDFYSSMFSANCFSNINVYQCVYTIAISHDFCSY